MIAMAGWCWMPPRELLIELALSWLDKAKGDLEFAYAGRAHERAPGWGIAFHCQQAVEKSLKGAITLHDVEVPRTHDVVRLRAALLDLGTAFPLVDEEVQALLPFAVDDRYPRLTLSDVSRVDALELLPVAERAVAWLDGVLRDR